MAAHLQDKLNNIYSVVGDTEGTIMEAKVGVHTDRIGLTDRLSQGPMTGSTGAAISAIRRPGRQRLRRSTLSGRG